MKRSAVLLGLGLVALAGCGQDPEVTRARAPRDAIPEAVEIAATQVNEGVKTGKIRQTREVAERVLVPLDEQRGLHELRPFRWIPNLRPE